MDTFDVYSSHGTVTANCNTGEVTEVSMDNGGEESYLKPITRFDIEEYKTHYKLSEIPANEQIDILRIGWWNKDGEYVEPEYEFRAEHDNPIEEG